VSRSAVGISSGVENGGPEKLLELNVFVSRGENVLFLARVNVVSLLKTVDFINSCIMHDCVHQRSSFLQIFFKEELVALLLDDDIVHQNGELVPEAFIIELVAFLDHGFEGLS